ncbi:IS607 family transposase [Paraburkholderia sp. GAS42]|uniref:IS607 family transposase n=1 Tax=Paraburkholderia sp. GAS42 TaxID=3035135 RepID=UPI003D1A6C6D
MRLLSIGEAAEQLGVVVGTLRRWHRQGRLAPAGRTVGDHRRYLRDALCSSLNESATTAGKTVCYARVSSHDKATQLETQAARLEKHCVDAGFADIEVVTDLGSGLNYRKKGLQRLPRARLAPFDCIDTLRVLRRSERLPSGAKCFHVAQWKVGKSAEIPQSVQ